MVSSASAPLAIKTSRPYETPAWERTAWSVSAEGTVCAAGVTATAGTMATSASVTMSSVRSITTSCVEVSVLSLSAF